MDERVIKAAAQGIVDGTRNWSRDRVPAEWPVEFAQAEAAIRAADAARAEQGFVVVRRDDLAWVMKRADRPPNPDAYHRLTAALGDGENVIEGE